MNNFLRKAIAVFIIILLSGALFFSYNHIARNLETSLSKYLEANLNTPISIGSVGLRLPLCLILKDVSIGNIINIRAINIYPNVFPFFLKDRVIVATVKVVEPVIEIKKEDNLQELISNLKPSQPFSNNFARGFYLSRILIYNGSVIFKVNENDTWEFTNFKGNLQAAQLYKPGNNLFHFAGVGFLKNKDSDFLSPLKIDGQIEQDGNIKTRLLGSDIKIELLGPIYRKYLSSIVDNGRMDFEGDIQVSKSNLMAKCFFEAEDILLKNDLEGAVNPPLVASFIVLFSFKNKSLKIRNLQSNFLNLLFDRTT